MTVAIRACAVLISVPGFMILWSAMVTTPAVEYLGEVAVLGSLCCEGYAVGNAVAAILLWRLTRVGWVVSTIIVGLGTLQTLVGCLLAPLSFGQRVAGAATLAVHCGVLLILLSKPGRAACQRPVFARRSVSNDATGRPAVGEKGGGPTRARP